MLFYLDVMESIQKCTETIDDRQHLIRCDPGVAVVVESNVVTMTGSPHVDALLDGPQMCLSPSFETVRYARSWWQVLAISSCVEDIHDPVRGKPSFEGGYMRLQGSFSHLPGEWAYLPIDNVPNSRQQLLSGINTPADIAGNWKVIFIDGDRFVVDASRAEDC